MPSSTPAFISRVLESVIKRHRIEFVLDIGIGFGKWGLLCREYLDAYHGRVFPGEWRAVIEGIEIFPEYAAFPWNRSIYSRVHVGDALYHLNRLPKYDLIIAGDVIEHLPKPAAETVLRTIKIRATQLLVISLPLGTGWLNNQIVAGNENEKHRSAWTKEEVVRLIGEPTHYQEVPHRRGPIALFLYEC